MTTGEPGEIKACLEEMGLEVVTKTLPFGDYEVSPTCIAERKAGPDFSSSICDTRAKKQIQGIIDSGKQPVLVLEGFHEMFKHTTMGLKSIYGYLAKRALKKGVIIIPTLNKEHTAVLLERLAHHAASDDQEESEIARVAPKGMTIDERKRFIVEGLVNCGPKLAGLLVTMFGTPLNVFKAIQATEVLYTRTGNPKGIKGPLELVRGIGPKFVLENKKLLE